MKTILDQLSKEELKWINNSCAYVKDKLNAVDKSHDWLHIERVIENCFQILISENADIVTVLLGAIFHDIADHKLVNQPSEAIETTIHFLREMKLPEKKITQITYIIENVSFSGGHFKEDKENIELMVVRDADKLDAIGAIGIARCFQYGGHKKRVIFDPKIKPITYQNKSEYYKSDAPSINHFYEKLLLLKDLILTPTAKKIAQERHEFMCLYLEQFHKECGSFND